MKTPVLNIAPGKTVDYHGEPCLVLEHRKAGTLMLHLDQMTHAFGSSNNFAASSLRSHLNGPYLRSLTDGNPDEIITRTVDLTALNGSKEYGTCECKVAPSPWMSSASTMTFCPCLRALSGPSPPGAPRRSMRMTSG